MRDTWWLRPDELDEDQKKIITLSLDGSYLITGPPGSGKTNLLLLRANYAVQGGRPNLLILTIARTLREFLAAGSEKYAFPADKVKTSQRWAFDFLREYGVKSIEVSGDYLGQRKSLLEQLCVLVEEQGLENVFEVILIDEAQDFWPAELELFSRLSRRIFAVGDPHQKIYPGDDALATLAGIVDESIPLRFHYRNGLKICKLADAIARPSSSYTPLVPTIQYDEKSRPSSVEVIRHSSLTAQIAEAINRITVQIKAYPGELIGVVCPLRADLESVWAQLTKSPIAKFVLLQDSSGGYSQFDPDVPVWVSTLHGSKGLEYRALHILGAEGLRRFGLNRNMTYTAVTRTKTALSIYHADPLPGYLEQALVDLEPAGEMPTLGGAFGKDLE